MDGKTREESDTTEAMTAETGLELSPIRSFTEIDCAWELAPGHPGRVVPQTHGESYRLQLLHIHPVIPTSLSTTDPST